MTSGCRRGKPARGLARVLLDSAAFLVERRQRVLRFRAARAGGGAEQLGGARKILRELLTLEIQQREVIGRRRGTKLRRRREELRRFAGIALAAAAAETHEAKLEHGFPIAPVGGALVQFSGLGFVRRNAKAVGVEFGQQRHGFRIVLFLHPPLRFDQRGEVMPALISAISHVALRGGGREWRRSSRAFRRRLGRRPGLRLRGYDQHERQQNADDARRHFTASVCCSRCAASATAAAGPRGSFQTKSTATKSAPAAASAPTSSRLVA